MINQNLCSKPGFDPGRFEPVIVMAHVPDALIVNPGKLGASTVPAFVDDLRKHPENVGAATQGNRTTSHLTAELFQMMAKVTLRSIPYRGSAPALQGLLAGEINAAVNEALRQAEVQERLKKLSAETFGGSAEEAADHMRQGIRRWGDVIKAATVSLQ